jgi:hypothetical protein
MANAVCTHATCLGRSLECASSNQLHTPHIHVLHALLMVLHGPLGRHPLKAMNGLEIHGTDVSRPLITDTPALTFQELFHGRLGELAPSHQSPGSFGELVAAYSAAQPFDVLVLARPRSMGNVVSTRAIELRTLWIGHENRVYLSGAGVLGVMVVLLWQEMDQKIQM